MDKKQKLRILHAFLAKNDLMEEKKSIILEHTKQRTDSAGQMNELELSSLIDFFSRSKPSNKESANNMRRKIIAICASTMKMVKEGKPDMTRIYDFVEENGYLSKEFNQYSYDELPKLVSQFEKIGDYYASQTSKNLKKSDS